MEKRSTSDKRGGERAAGTKMPGARFPWMWILGAGCLVVVILGLLLPRKQSRSPTAPETSKPVQAPAAGGAHTRQRRQFVHATTSPGLTPEQTVASKASKFARKRRETTRAMAKHLGIEVPADVEKFFDLAEAGRWDELKALNTSLNNSRESGTNAALASLRGPIMETYGVAQIARDWPAQQLLDYGETILDSLRPGMVYVGGTDPGRFIPALLNETGDGDPHIILTQNALADSSYLDYERFLYGDQMTGLSPEDQQKAFQDYTADARQRYDHDQQFPDEPRQVRPGEDFSLNDGRFQISGEIAVMGINEILLQAIMNKNPDLSFALEESFPLKSTYGTAAPLGPIMELRVPDEDLALTPDSATQAVNYWQSTAGQLLTAGGDGSTDPYVLKTYAKMAAAQAALFADHQLPAQAEQVFQASSQIYPSSPDTVLPYVNLLVGQKRISDAIQVAQNAVNAAPANQQFLALLQQLKQHGN